MRRPSGADEHDLCACGGVVGGAGVRGGRDGEVEACAAVGDRLGDTAGAGTDGGVEIWRVEVSARSQSVARYGQINPQIRTRPGTRWDKAPSS